MRKQRNGGEALRVYEGLVRLLAVEFEAEPSLETQALIAQVRADGERKLEEAAPEPALAAR